MSDVMDDPIEDEEIDNAADLADLGVPVVLLAPIEQEQQHSSSVLSLPDGVSLPRLITNAGEQVTLRFINYFTAEIENDNTRMAYLRAVRQFDA